MWAGIDVDHRSARRARARARPARAPTQSAARRMSDVHEALRAGDLASAPRCAAKRDGVAPRAAARSSWCARTPSGSAPSARPRERPSAGAVPPRAEVSRRRPASRPATMFIGGSLNTSRRAAIVRPAVDLAASAPFCSDPALAHAHRGVAAQQQRLGRLGGGVDDDRAGRAKIRGSSARSSSRSL